MKIVCVNNGSLQEFQKKQNLTLGKIYDTRDKLYPISDNVQTTLEVKNDKGEIVLYKSMRFVTLDEWREMKLKSLGI